MEINDMNRRRRVPVRGLLIGTVIFILCGLMAIPMFIFNAGIQGQEFSPQLFQKREFTYRRFPGTKIRLGKTKLTPGISPCSTNILSHLSLKDKVDWHVSTVQQGSLTKELGPKILIDHLTSTNADGAQVWDAWSFKNSVHAAVLWPIVQQAAIFELYSCVPDLLRSADSELETRKFKKNLYLVCIQSAIERLKTLSASQDATTRRELRRWAQSLVEEFAADPEFQDANAELASL